MFIRSDFRNVDSPRHDCKLRVFSKCRANRIADVQEGSSCLVCRRLGSG